VRSGKANVPGIGGFGKAASIGQADREEEARRLRLLRRRLHDGLVSGIGGVTLNGPGLPVLSDDGGLAPGVMDRRLPGNLNLSFEHVEGEALLLAMKTSPSLPARRAPPRRSSLLMF
jgi:cysteine desulfurase